MARKLDLNGQRFGSLLVVAASTLRGHAAWECVCDCGTITNVLTGNLRSGNTTTCGCGRIRNAAKALTKHGHARKRKSSPEYVTWCGMIQRTTDTNSPNYLNYGGRGISVCPEWRRSFEAFLADMGKKPSKAFSLERIDNERGYSPENCKWATRREQVINRRVMPKFTFAGITRTALEWADVVGCQSSNVTQRLRRGFTGPRVLGLYVAGI